ncbi:hypothetical protein V8C37DRAFT_411754 [Trichoderma ceciliae]
MKLIPYESRPWRSLLVIFAAWKGFLLAIALGTTVSHDYDTSTSLFFEHMYGPGVNAPALATRLTRWDSLYYMKAARHGYVYEQQWAFGAALPVAVQATLRLFQPLHLAGDTALEPMVAIILTNFAHLAAVLALHTLTLMLFKTRTLAYVAAVLHILSPAGLFLSAPYAESPFACLSFIGNLLFAIGLQPSALTWKRILAFLGAGISFGLATSFRSNGLISGLIFAVEATKSLLALFRHPSFSGLALLTSLIIGGLCIAAGSVVPQTVAWFRYCKADLIGAKPRPWCSRLVPSIYTFVQAHYWNNGFLRYWSLNQLPLFLLASPMLALLIKSGLDVSFNLAITNFHVQIITRMSSGYPIWHWWVANSLSNGKSRKTGSLIVVFMIIETFFAEATKIMSQETQGENKHGASSDDAEADGDLNLWLQHTSFFDIEHRQKVLAALRKLKDIDEQRCKILLEIQTTTPCIVYPTTRAMPQSPTAPSTRSSSFLAAQWTDQSTPNPSPDCNSPLCSHSTAIPSSIEPCSSEISLVNKGADSDYGYMASGNGSSPSQQRDIPTPTSPIQQAPAGTETIPSLVDPGYESCKVQSPQTSDRSVKTEAGHLRNRCGMDAAPAQISTLAYKPEARYFLVKSFNAMNVEMSQRDGLWITKAKNGPIFTSAFHQHKNVFLIFSVNKSKAFQGYARLTTAPNADIATARWMSNISWQASSPFRIEWLNTRRTEFWKLGDLKNSFNDDAPVFFGRDGQEYPESCGRKIIEIMDRGTGERGVTSSWTTRQAYNDMKLAGSYPHSTSGKESILTWRHEDLPDAGELVSPKTVPELVCDMPLIEY